MGDGKVEILQILISHMWLIFVVPAAPWIVVWYFWRKG